MELAQPDSGLPDFDFPENVALALAVCREIGVDRNRALEGILRYQPDPYALSLFRLPSGAAFVNAMSVNDPQSTSWTTTGWPAAQEWWAGGWCC